MISINVFLFGKPGWEFGEKVFAEEIRSKGGELKSRLDEVAEVINKLSKSKWEYELTLYDIIFYKYISKAAAEKELKMLGIKKELCNLMEEYDE